MTTRAFLLFFVAAAGAFTTARAQTHTADTFAVDLQSAVTRALDISPEVSAVDADLSFAVARWRFAKANRYLTKIELTTGHAVVPGISNPNDTATDRLYLDPDVRNDWENLGLFSQVEAELLQPIATWGEIGGSIAAARYGADAERASVQEKRLEVAGRTAELYLNAVLAAELDQLTREAGDIVQQAKDEINRLLDEGAADVDDADLFQVLITEQEFLRRAAEIEQRRLTASGALRRQLFLPDETTIVTSRRLEKLIADVDTLETLQHLAQTRRPELQLAEAGLGARDELVRVAKSHLFPKVFFAGSYRFAYAPDRYRQPSPYLSDPLRANSIRAGLGLRQNLNFAQTRARIAQAAAERDKVRFQQEAAEQLVSFEVEQAYRDLIIASAAVSTRDEALRLSREWLRTEQINFDLELGDTENLVKAVESNLELRVAVLQALHSYNLAVVKLYKATGTLINAIDSGMLVEQ